MAITLYCVLATPKREVPPGLVGIDDAPVRCLEAPALSAWVSDAPADHMADVARVRAHDRVVTAALDTGATPLPARFGQRFASAAALMETLERQTPRLLSDLSRLQGLVELSVIVASRDAAGELAEQRPERISVGERDAGHRYLAALREREIRAATAQRHLEDAADAVCVLVAGISVAQIADRQGNAVAYSVAHLVPRTAVQEFRTAVARAQNSRYRIIVAGPRAPYSFASVAPDVDSNSVAG
jgi:hypothetical protein